MQNTDLTRCNITDQSDYDHKLSSGWGTLHFAAKEGNSEMTQLLCDQLGIDKPRTTPYHPQSDGLMKHNCYRAKDTTSADGMLKGASCC